MFFIVLILEALKFEKLILVIEEHSLNILFTLVIKEELKLDKSTDIIFSTFGSFEESKKLSKFVVSDRIYIFISVFSLIVIAWLFL